SRMSRLGRSEITTGEFLTVQETMDRLQAVTAEDVRRLAADLYAQPRHLTVVGPFDDDVAAVALPTGSARPAGRNERRPAPLGWVHVEQQQHAPRDRKSTR